MRVTTEFSTYEVSTGGKVIRRVASEHEATDRQGKDGQWRCYDTLVFDTDGRMLIIWDAETGESTITSRVISVGPSDEN